MAVFEKKIPRKVFLYDTETLKATIENAQNVNGHTEYIIKVQRESLHESTWFVSKRYSDFLALDSLLKESDIDLPLPPKKLIGNMNRNFIEERKIALEEYLYVILMNPILSTCLHVRKFLDPQNYSAPLQEQALQHVSMALRSENNYELIKLIPDMGWRIRKHYFLVERKSVKNVKNVENGEVLLQWMNYGPDKYLEDKELQSVLKFLTNLRHPYIEEIEYMHFNDVGCFTIRQYCHSGSLRDHISVPSFPQWSFLKKYANPVLPKPLSENEISLYGRQILEALIFLNENEIPYGHLHLSNIVLVDNKIKLLDIENSILGLSSYYRPYILQTKINTMEAIDVYCFGHVLYEMAMGFPLQKSACDFVPNTCPASIRQLIYLILAPEVRRGQMPSLWTLIQHPFFSTKDKLFIFPLKINDSIRESLHIVSSSIKRRLVEEQQNMSRRKMFLKMQTILSSEEKRKKKSRTLEDDKKVLHRHKSNKSLDTSKKSSPRSGSPTSRSLATSDNTDIPPLPVANNRSSPKNADSALGGRAALMDSICSFDKSGLRRTPLNA